MTQREILERRILLTKQALQLVKENKAHFLEALGGEKALKNFIDEQLDKLIEYRNQLDELD